MERKTLVRLTFVLVLLNTPALIGPARSQNSRAYPSFTLVKRVIDYDPEGNAVPVLTETLYASSRGDWRWEARYQNGRQREQIFLMGKGLYFGDYRNKRLVKFSDCVIAICKPSNTTSEGLRLDPKFVRTEQVVGIIAYVHEDKRDRSVAYYAPETGSFPLEGIIYYNGYKRVEEPVGLTFGEPEPSLLKGPDFPFAETRPAFDNQLSTRWLNKPPTNLTTRNDQKSVIVEVIVDESGNVIDSWSVGPICYSSFGHAAMEAGYQAHFTPKELAGKPIKTMGLITYEFAP